MKKTMLTLIALLVMGFQLAGAQTYEVEYSGKPGSEAITKIINETLKETKISPSVLDTVQLRKDYEDMVLANKSIMSEDKVISEMIPSKSHFEVHMGGMSIDMIKILSVAEMENYYDGVKNESYIGLFNPMDQVRYLVKQPRQESPSFKQIEGSKTILGHECKIMETEKITVDLSNFNVPGLDGKSVTSKIKVWYATDIPFEMKGYFKGIPGLILGYETEIQGIVIPVFATSIKKTDSEITCPEGKVITLAEYLDMMKKSAADMRVK